MAMPGPAGPDARPGARLLRASVLSLAAALLAQATDCDMGQCYFRSGSRYEPTMDAPKTTEIAPEACQARCANTTGCEFFTFTQEPAKLPDLTGSCELHSANSQVMWSKLPGLSGPAVFPTCCVEVPLLVDLTVTFGAPAISFPAASNPGLRCFKGYRIYTENPVLPGGGYGKQEDGAAMHTRFPHSKSNVVVLRDSSDGENPSEVFKCVQYPNSTADQVERMPLWKAAMYHDWNLHSITGMYKARLENFTLPAADDVSQERVQRYVQLGVNIAMMADTTYLESAQGALDAVRGNLPAYKLVGYALISGSLFDKDMVLLLQTQETGHCTVAFEGSNGMADLAAFGSDYGTGYCGFQNTHVGVRNELWSITNTPQWKEGISDKLTHCETVSCVGHSLGGALCELFTLCANSNHKGHPDYDALAWEKGDYMMMPEVNPWESTLYSKYSRLWDKPDEAAAEPRGPALRSVAPSPAARAAWCAAALAAVVGLAALALRALDGSRRSRALALGGLAEEGRGGSGSSDTEG